MVGGDIYQNETDALLNCNHMVYYICPWNKPALIDIKQSSYIGFIFFIIFFY